MENTWVYEGPEPIKIKAYLQSLGMGHRLFNEIKQGAGRFLVDHRQVRPTTKILPHQPLTIEVAPEARDQSVVVSDAELPLVYEDTNWLVIDKPVGVAAVPGPSGQTDTVLNRVTGFLVRQGAPDQRPHLITRLDRDTAGLMLVAKHRVASSMISRQVEDHTMVKEYRAIVAGNFAADHGLIDAPLARVAGQARRVVAPDGQSARTEYWVERQGDGWSLLRLRLHTGRTHQIRVHMSSQGHPLLGDRLYGGPTDRFTHQALYASRLVFTDPFTGQPRVFEAREPEEFRQFLK